MCLSVGLLFYFLLISRVGEASVLDILEFTHVSITNSEVLDEFKNESVLMHYVIAEYHFLM